MCGVVNLPVICLPMARRGRGGVEIASYSVCGTHASIYEEFLITCRDEETSNNVGHT